MYIPYSEDGYCTLSVMGKWVWRTCLSCLICCLFLAVLVCPNHGAWFIA